jgi:hypothetical protein
VLHLMGGDYSTFLRKCGALKITRLENCYLLTFEAPWTTLETPGERPRFFPVILTVWISGTGRYPPNVPQFWYVSVTIWRVLRLKK